MSRLVDAIFRITDEFSKPLKDFNTALSDVGRQGRQARKQIEKVGISIANVGTGLTAGITVPLATLGASSYSTFESVNKQLELVEATMGEANYATADLYKELGDAAVNSIFSMEEGAAALVNYARQGWDAAQAADMLAPALNLAAGTATDLDSVTSGLGNTLKAFGADSGEAAHYVDMFTQAQAQANTDVQQLFEAMSIAGSITKTVGWGFEDLATLVGVFGDNNISASEGAHALSTGLMRLADPAKQGATALESLGINAFDAYGNLLEMPDLIEELQKGFDGLSDQEALTAASRIFGKNQAPRWVSLINNADVDVLREMSASIVDAYGNAQLAADALVTPTEKLKSTFDVFKVSVGSLLADVAVPLINKATELVDVFRQLNPEQQQTIIKMAGIAAAAGPALLVFGKLIIGASHLMGAFATISHAGGLLKAGFAAASSPAGILIGAFAGIAAIALVLATHIDEVKAGIATMYEKNAPYIDAIGEAWNGLVETMAPILTWVVDVFSAGVLGAFKGIVEGDGVTVILDGIATSIDGVKNVASGLITFLSGTFSADWKTAWEGIKTSFEGIIDLILGPLESLAGLIQSVGEGVKGLATDALEKAKTGWNDSFVGKYIPIGGNASGTSYWQGGFTRVNESGGEIINLPSGTQIIPHDASRNTPVGAGNINIAKLADSIVVREEADIDRITDMLTRKLIKAQDNMGAMSMA